MNYDRGESDRLAKAAIVLVLLIAAGALAAFIVWVSNHQF